MNPILSIVIANYNYGSYLEAAISSVISQPGFDECELIVVDGGSSDNSLDVIRKYQDKIAWWISEKDSGQSNAFNKGFSRARGKYLTWVNADDIMHAGCLQKVLSEMKKHPDCEWFTGNFYRFNKDGAVLEIGWGPHFYPKMLQHKNSPLVIFGPSTFFSKKIYDKYGRIDESLHYIMDNDLWERFIVSGEKQRRIRAFCWGFRMHEMSKTAEFGLHCVSSDTKEKMRNEVRYSLKKTGYKASSFMHMVLLLFRCIDGSLVVRFWLQKTFRKVGVL